jgi:4-diphosphocytidyl-2-C-methyl-D-erythritol kinase
MRVHDSVLLKAYAKVNLSFDVLGLRIDGYHDIRTVMQTIDLADELILEPADSLILEVSPRHTVPPDDNLAIQAARALQVASGCARGTRIRLLKRIPEAAGLGGGSADAAAVLVGLNWLWDLNLSQHRLIEIASTLGSDVPFFIIGGTALVEGKGELITPLPNIPARYMIILTPDISPVDHLDKSKTSYLYSLLRPEHYTNGHRTEQLLKKVVAGQDIDGLVSNTFEEVAEKAFPGLSEYKSLLLRQGATVVLLCGSGPALAAFSPSMDKAQRAFSALSKEDVRSYIIQTVPARVVDDERVRL